MPPPRRRRPSIDCDDTGRPSGLTALLDHSSSAPEKQKQACILRAHMASGKILTRSACKVLSSQQGHTANKMTAVQGAEVVNTPKSRPQKRRASSTAENSQKAKRTRVRQAQGEENSGEAIKTTLNPTKSPSKTGSSNTATKSVKSSKKTDTSTEASPGGSPSTTPGKTRPTSKSSSKSSASKTSSVQKTPSTEATPGSSSSKTSSTQTMPSTEESPGSSSFNASSVDMMPSSVKNDSRPEVVTESATRGSSSKGPLSMTARESTEQAESTKRVDSTKSIDSAKRVDDTEGIDSTERLETTNTTSAHQAPCPKTSPAGRGDKNTQGSKGPQETNPIPIPKESPNASQPASGCSTEDRSRGEAQVNDSEAAEMSRDEQEANGISNHQSISDISPIESANGGAEGGNQNEAVATDVEMGEAGLNAESLAGPDEEPDKRLVALLGFAVGAGAAAAQFFAS